MTAEFLQPGARLASSMLRAAPADILLSTVVCAVVWIVCRALGSRWPAFQQGLWALVLLRLILPPSLAQPYGLGTLLGTLGVSQSWSGDEVDGRPSGGAAPPASGSAAPAGATREVGWPVLLGGAWALTAGGLMLRDRRRLASYRRLIRSAKRVQDPWALDCLGQGRARLGIRRPVHLLATTAGVVPFTLGLVRPVIVVPEAILAAGRRRALATAVSHELAHVARWDYLWLSLEQPLRWLYFFHPVVWLVARRLRSGRERMCDALVVTRGLVSARRYVGGLLDVLELGLRPVAVPSLTTRQRRMVMRIRSIVAVRPESRRQSILTFAAVAALGFVLLPLASTGPAAAGLSSGDNPLAATNAPQPLVHPLPGARITMSFGETTHPITGKPYSHKGVDLAAPLGTPVVATAAGVVEVATLEYVPAKAAGRVVIVDHGCGLKTFYAHLDAFTVKAGRRVAAGEVLGRVGHTGVSAGPHLHLEVWQDGVRVDPALRIAALGQARR